MKAYTIMIGADLHFIAPELIKNHELFVEEELRADGRVTHYSGEILDAFLDTVIEKRPDLLVIAGDLTYNGEMQSHLELSRRLDAVRFLGIPVAVIPGNHDLNNKRAASYSGWKKEPVLNVNERQFERIYRNFGIGDSLYRCKDSYSYVWALNEETWLLFVDANKPDSEGIVSLETLQWIEEVLKAAYRKHIQVIGVSHQNLVHQNSLIHNGYTINNAKKVRELYDKYGVTLNLSGHIHLQHQRAWKALTDIATGSLTLVPGRYGLLTCDGESYQYEKRELDVENWAARYGIMNRDLLGFREYSDRWYKKINVAKTMRKIRTLGLPLHIMHQLSEGYVMLNQAYFSGDLEVLCREREANVRSIYRQWNEYAQDVFFTVYLKSMLEEYMEI